MSYKLKILKNLTVETYTSYSELIQKCPPQNLDIFSLDIDDLRADMFILGLERNNEIFLTLALFSSVNRFKRVRRNTIIKSVSFILSVVMLIIATTSLVLQIFL